MVALAVAVVPIPTPITGGALTLTVALAYPLPAFVISNDVIVPADETIAVAAVSYTHLTLPTINWV